MLERVWGRSLSERLFNVISSSASSWNLANITNVNKAAEKLNISQQSPGDDDKLIRKSLHIQVQNPLGRTSTSIYVDSACARPRRALFLSPTLRLCMSMSKTSVNVLCQFSSSRNVVFGPFTALLLLSLLLLPVPVFRFAAFANLPPDPSADENFFPKPQTFPIKIILNAPTREYMTRKKFFRFFFFLRCYHKIFSSYRLLLALRFSLPHPMAWRSFISEVYSRLFIAYSVLVFLIHAPTANGENSCVSCVKKVLFMSNKITTEFQKVSLISVRFPK